MDGDVLAFHRRGFWGAAIRLRTSARVSHVGFAARFRGRLCVVEAQEGRGVQVVPFTSYQADVNIEAFWYRLRAEQFGVSRTAVIDLALSHWGCRYSSPLQFVRSWGLVSEPLCDCLGICKDLDPQRFFCSEFVLSSLRGAGYCGNPEFEPIRSSPGDVIELDCLERMARCA